jgi:hypothetical protein
MPVRRQSSVVKSMCVRQVLRVEQQAEEWEHMHAHSSAETGAVWACS